MSQAAHEALTRAGMRGKRFRAWVAGGGATVVLGDITDPVAFNAVVRDAPAQIRADVADALAEAFTAAVVLGDITDPVAFNAVACGVETSEVLNRHCFV